MSRAPTPEPSARNASFGRDVIRLNVAEDDLLRAVTDALTYRDFVWHHVRRSDRALQMGTPGFPDLLASNGTRAFALELKSETGTVTVGQRRWLDALHLRTLESLVLRPGDLDAFIKDIW